MCDNEKFKGKRRRMTGGNIEISMVLSSSRAPYIRQVKQKMPVPRRQYGTVQLQPRLNTARFVTSIASPCCFHICPMLLIPLTNSAFLSFTFLIFFFFVFRFSSLSSSNKSIQLVTSSGYVTAILLICMLRFLGYDLTASERETAVSPLAITKRFSILWFSRKFRVGRNRVQVWLKRLKGTR